MAPRKPEVTETDEPMGFGGGEIDFNAFTGGKGLWDGYDPSRAAGGDFTPIDEGTYNAEVVQVQGPVKNKAGDGYILKVQYRVLDEPFANRRVFDTISLKPQSLWKLQQFLVAMGREPGDTRYDPGEFDGYPCTIKVKIEAARDGYDARNRVDRVTPIEEHSLDPATRW